MAFGDGSVLWEDQFTYSDGSLSTVGSAEWTNGFWTGQASLRVVSNQVAGPASNAWTDNYTLDSFSVGADGVDYIARAVTKAGPGTSTFFYLFGTPATSPSGYHMTVAAASGTDALRFGTITSGSYTNLIDVAQEWTNGDDLGCRIMPDGTCSLYYRPTAGSWTQVGTNVTNTTYTSGVIAVEFFETTNRADAVELRSAAVPSSAVPRRRTLLGVGV